MAKQNFQKFAVVLAKYVVLILAVFWLLINIYVNIQPYEQAIKQMNTILGIDFSTWSNVINNPQYYDQTLVDIYQQTFKSFFVISSVTSVIGAFAIARTRNPLEILGIFAGFFIPRQNKKWGVVVDSVTNNPIAFAVVRLYNGAELVSQGVSDLDGHYRLNLDDDAISGVSYTLKIEAEGYSVYEHAFEVGRFSLVKPELVEDIPLVRSGETLGLTANLKYRLKSWGYNKLFYILYVLAVIGFLRSLYGALLYESIDGIVSVILFGSSVIWNSIILKDRFTGKIGRIVDKISGTAIAGAMLTVYSGDRRLGTYITDRSGVVKFDLEPGEYLLKVDKQGYVMESEGEVAKSDLLNISINNFGYLSQDIAQRMVSVQTAGAGQLQNPFANS